MSETMSMFEFPLVRSVPGTSTSTGLLIAALLMAATSCGQRGSGIHPVTGTVRYQGAPAAGAVVFFSRAGSKAASDQSVMGIVRNDGTFELVCGAIGKGAPSGDYDVFIEWREVLNQQQGGPRRGPDKLEGRYTPRHPARFHASIKAEKNLLPPFELTDD